MSNTIYPQDTGYDAPASTSFDQALDLDAAIDEEAQGQANEPAYNEPAYNARDNDHDADEDSSEDSSARSTKGAAKSNNRSQFRRVAQKALDINAASETARTLAASVLGCPSAPADLTAYIMTAPRQSTSPLADIAQVAEEIISNPLLAGITPASWESPRLRAVWAVLHGLDAVNSPSAPASSAKAAGTVLQAVNGFSDDDKAELANAAELLKRS